MVVVSPIWRASSFDLERECASMVVSIYINAARV
jgi:hypothetical protein